MLQSKHLQVSVIYSRDTHAGGGGGGSCSIKTMLDANDIQVLRSMFAEQEVRIEHSLETKLEMKLEQKLEQKLDQKLDQKLSVFRDELVTEMTAKIHAVLHTELYKVRNDIIDVINGVLPQIDGIDRRVSRLERWARIT